MKVLILGATGHIGGRLAQMLEAQADTEVVRASRSQPAGAHGVQVDTMDDAGLSRALQGMDAVINCVAGSADSIAQGAQALARAAAATGSRIVHMSTMSVYGRAQGSVREDAPFDPGLGWYARAKCEAEAHMAAFVQQGGECVVLRPGCVGGPGSELWVGRVGRWLRAHRLGDLGAVADGWTNLVHVDDVCRAVIASLRLPLQPGRLEAFNLAAADSPRWNGYFVDLALAIGAAPVRRLTARRLTLDAMLLGPPLKVTERLAAKLHFDLGALPDAMPPALVRFWGQQIWLDSTAAERALGLHFTSYADQLQDSAQWFRTQR
ncbi:MAG: NAD-dependent epimerase/dehydratase family protein [Proteobacteria bacterium]|nr:NAD-dependent epimerase/dehydratase family protein [Pseudomonadota bacterium]